MQRTTGMVILQNDVGRSSIFSRGYEIDQMLVNGLSAPLSSIYGTQPDLAIFDRLDVLKGPARPVLWRHRRGRQFRPVRHHQRHPEARHVQLFHQWRADRRLLGPWPGAGGCGRQAQ